MSKIHYEVVDDSFDGKLSIKQGSFKATIEVEDFKWSELAALIDEWWAQEDLPEDTTPLSVVRNNDGALQIVSNIE